MTFKSSNNKEKNVPMVVTHASSSDLIFCPYMNSAVCCFSRFPCHYLFFLYLFSCCIFFLTPTHPTAPRSINSVQVTICWRLCCRVSQQVSLNNALPLHLEQLTHCPIKGPESWRFESHSIPVPVTVADTLPCVNVSEYV